MKYTLELNDRMPIRFLRAFKLGRKKQENIMDTISVTWYYYYLFFSFCLFSGISETFFIECRVIHIVWFFSLSLLLLRLASFSSSEFVKSDPDSSRNLTHIRRGLKKHTQTHTSSPAFFQEFLILLKTLLCFYYKVEKNIYLLGKNKIITPQVSGFVNVWPIYGMEVKKFPVVFER